MAALPIEADIVWPFSGFNVCTASDSQLPQRPCLSRFTANRQSIHHQRFMGIEPPKAKL